jgi:hypothetical protein
LLTNCLDLSPGDLQEHTKPTIFSVKFFRDIRPFVHFIRVPS